MTLTHCTFTGVDNKTKLEDLIFISKEFPFVEWAVLVYDFYMGNSRYPSSNKIGEIVEFTRTHQNLSFSAHMCGENLQRFLNGEETVLNSGAFKRAQLNFIFTKMDIPTPQEFSKLIASQPNIEFIIQYKENEMSEWLAGFEGNYPSNMSLVFDSSAGTGQLSENWASPLDGIKCGYAGGLSPQNYEEQLESIAQVAQGHPFWTDMETGVRGKNKQGEDIFDLDKVSTCLKIASKYQ